MKTKPTMHDLYIYGLIGMFILSASLTATTTAVPLTPQATADDYPDDDYPDYDDAASTNVNISASSSPTTTNHNTSQPFISVATLMSLQNKLEIPARTNYVLEPVCPTVCQCLDDFKTIDCSGGHLTATPKDLPITTITLNLSSNDITNVADDAFHNLPKLQEINLSHNQLKTLNKEVFTGLRTLERLRLEYNAFEHIPADAFEHAVNLKELYLSNNPLKQSSNGGFLHQPQLKQLHCNNCTWTELYDDIFANMTGLEILMLEQNQLDAEINTRAFAPLQSLIKLALPTAHQDSLTELCQLLKSIDNISFDNYTLSCFELVLGTAFDESIKSKYPQQMNKDLTMNANNQSSNMTNSMDTTSSTASTILSNVAGNTTMESPLNATDASVVLKANAAGGGGGGDDESTYQVPVSQEVINILLISIMVIATIGILIGIVCRRDVCGIKTKCCRTRKPKPDEPQQPAEEILLNKLA